MTLPWTCSHCGTRHRDDGAEEKCRLEQRSARRLALLVVFVVSAVLLAAAVSWAAYAYGDWKCAFIECRKVFP